MTGEADGPGPIRRAWRAWRRWRHTRPFWGGLLVTLGGLVILASERAPLPLVIHIGLQGLAGYLVPVVMVLLGLLMWFHPVQRLFYSLLAIVLSLGSWVTSNLGGFFVGMLLGLIGGSLAFAWVQRDRRDPARHRGTPKRRTSTSVGLEIVRGEQPGAPADEQASRRNRHSQVAPGAVASLPIPLFPLAPLALSVLAAVAARGLMTGTVPVPALASVPLLDSPTPFVTPTAFPSFLRTPMPSATATATPSPAPSASPSPAPSASPSPAPSATPSPVPSQPVSRHAPVARAGVPTAPVAGDRSGLTSRFAVLEGVSYDGIASVPTAHGTKLMLKFSMSYLKLPGIVLTATQGGHAFMTRDSSLELSGHVELYTTRLTGNLNGIRVTFTSGEPPSGLRPDLTLANVVADQPFVTANSLRATGSLASSG